MRIAFGADDENATTAAVLAYLRSAGHIILAASPSDNWVEIGSAVGAAVVAGEADYGVVMCWTGTGTAIAANKVPGVRAALAWEPWIARGARLWNDANVLVLSLKRVSPQTALDILEAWFKVEAPDPSEGGIVGPLAEWQAVSWARPRCTAG